MGSCTFLEDLHQEHPLRSKETPAQGHDEPQLLLPACWRTAEVAQPTSIKSDSAVVLRLVRPKIAGNPVVGEN
jgi:hypothetical protein